MFCHNSFNAINHASKFSRNMGTDPKVMSTKFNTGEQERERDVKKRKGKQWSPGLVVMGGDSCSKGHEFKSQYRILDGHFFTFICRKNCNVCNEKESAVGRYFYKKKSNEVYRRR